MQHRSEAHQRQLPEPESDNEMVSNVKKSSLEDLESIIESDGKPNWITPDQIQFSRPIMDQADSNKIHRSRVRLGREDTDAWETDDERLVDYYLWVLEKTDPVSVATDEAIVFVKSIHRTVELFRSTYAFSLTAFAIAPFFRASDRQSVRRCMEQMPKFGDSELDQEWNFFMQDVLSQT